MTSGVYQLRFANGQRYIGKSVNIQNRWTQHFDKMRKGTAAKAMQEAFSRYGAPDGEILLECHADHIDIMEAVFIARHRPELNSDRPADPFPGIDIDWYIENTDFLSVPTIRHMELLAEDSAKVGRLQEKILQLTEEVEELEELNDTLLLKRSEEELSTAAGKKLRNVSNSVSLLNRELIKVKDENIELKQLLAYATRPWWKKLLG